jgi:hypothetical protein
MKILANGNRIFLFKKDHPMIEILIGGKNHESREMLPEL